MRLIKPEFVSHTDSKGNNRNAIYSVDTQVSGDRIATAGGDATVKIWHLQNILSSASAEAVQNCLLATLCNHTKSVNVVRWSPDSSFLASGSDDHYILVYQRNESSSLSAQPFGAPSISNKENWSRCMTLQGHSMDVLDVAWSPTLLLASASIDNKVIVWNCAQYSSGVASSIVPPLIVLNDHTSFVKGVAFDPMGTYLSSLSADNKCLIYNAKSFALESTITEPLLHSIDKSIFRRHSWAPDGSALSLCSAVKNNRAIGAVLKRKTWQGAADLIGHISSTTCCKFNPKLLRHSSGEACCVVAVGDQLGTISVWTSAQASAVLVIEEVFASSVVDISWCGRTLCAASVDGSISIVALDDVLGEVLSGDETEQHLKRIYGEVPSVTPSILVRQPTSVHLQSTSSDRAAPIFHSNVTVTKDGKKRLQPTLLSSSGVESAAAPININTQKEPIHEKPAGTVMTFYRDRVVCRPRSVKILEGGITVDIRNSADKLVCRRMNVEGHTKTLLSSIARIDSQAACVWETAVVADVTACASFDTNGNTGLVVVGSSDGSINVLSAEFGVRILPPLLLGGAIMHVDCLAGEKGSVVMAATVLGDVYVWSYGAHGLRLSYHATLEPVLISMKATNTITSGCDIVVESVTLEENSDVQVTLWQEGECGGGAWLRCIYSPVSGVWMRSSDTCHILSSLFPSDSPLRLDTESALHVGRLLYTETVTVNESIARCTIAHIEEKLSIAMRFRRQNEFKECLKKWVQLCCKENQTIKVKNVFRQMLVPSTCDSWMKGAKITNLLGMNMQEVLDDIVIPAAETCCGKNVLAAALRETFIQQ